MKTMLRFAMVLALVLNLAYAEPDPIAPDVRKARHPASGPTNYNAISGPDSETLSKLQNQVAPSVQIPLKLAGQQTKTSEAPLSYSGTSNQPPGVLTPASAQTYSGQYYMMTPQATGNQMLAPATTPLIMQYINPQGQPTGGLQYIQLLRPILYPYGGAGAAQYLQPSYVQQHQQAAAALSQHQHLHHPHHSLSHYSVGHSPTSPPNAPSTTQSSFVPFQPSSPLQHYTAATTASHHLQQAAPAAFSNPVGQYSSPVLSYFSPRISLINSPGDMGLNTNEYMPPPGDHVYIKGVKSMRA